MPNCTAELAATGDHLPVMLLLSAIAFMAIGGVAFLRARARARARARTAQPGSGQLSTTAALTLVPALALGGLLAPGAQVTPARAADGSSTACAPAASPSASPVPGASSVATPVVEAPAATATPPAAVAGGAAQSTPTPTASPTPTVAPGSIRGTVWFDDSGNAGDGLRQSAEAPFTSSNMVTTMTPRSASR